MGVLQLTNAQIHEEKLKEWSGRIQERESSGMSVAQWCRENHVKTATYYKWLHHIRETESTTARFVELPVKEEPKPKKTEFEITTVIRVGKVVFELSDGTPAEMMDQILGMVRHAI